MTTSAFPTLCVRSVPCAILMSLFSLSSSGCVSWMDSELVEKDVEESWEPVVLSGDEHAIEALAIYEVAKGSKMRAGLRPVVDPDGSGSDLEEVVLGPGDVVQWGSGVATLKRRTDIELEPAAPAGPVIVSPAFVDGYCEAVAHTLVPLGERRTIEQYFRVPKGYRLDGQFYTPEEVDSSQLLLWLFLPPVELGRLLTRALGGSFVEPTSYTEELVDSYTVPKAGGEVRQYFRPVAGRTCRWELALASSDGELTVDGEVTTGPSGRAVIPIWEHAKTVRENFDFGTAARLTVRSVNSREPAELTVNLLKLSLEEPR